MAEKSAALSAVSSETSVIWFGFIFVAHISEAERVFSSVAYTFELRSDIQFHEASLIFLHPDVNSLYSFRLKRNINCFSSTLISLTHTYIMKTSQMNLFFCSLWSEGFGKPWAGDSVHTYAAVWYGLINQTKTLITWTFSDFLSPPDFGTQRDSRAAQPHFRPTEPQLYLHCITNLSGSLPNTAVDKVPLHKSCATKEGFRLCAVTSTQDTVVERSSALRCAFGWQRSFV